MGLNIITGANRGIGLELCRQLAARGASVLAVCRSSNDALSALGVEVLDGIDVTADEALAVLGKAVGDRTIDWLINNAGLLESTSLDDLDAGAMRRQFEVNAIAPLRVTGALLPNMASGSKVGIVTSRMGSIDDNTSGGAYGYRMSKAAANIAGVSLARDLAPRGIHVALLHPGLVATRMTDHNGISVTEAAAGLMARMEDLDETNTGTFWHANGEVLPW